MPRDPHDRRGSRKSRESRTPPVTLDRDYRHLVERLAGHIAARIGKSLPGSPVYILANPAAGDVRRNQRILQDISYRLDDAVRADVDWTERAGYARERVEQVVAGRDRSLGPLVVVSIGGDGTHNEICGTVVGGPVSKEDVLFLRVPLGSGNDGADAQTPAELVETLDGLVAPRNVPAVVVETRCERFTALNIASFGLDAFVTVTRERARRLLHGNGYKFVADTAVLFYEKIVRLQQSTVRFPDGRSWTDQAMLIAFGASGKRSYGGHIHVLPDDRNVCVISRSGIRDKVRLKRLFYEGKHTEDSLVTMDSADYLTIECAGDLHYQVDGEGGVLTAEAFPVVVRRLERALRVLGPARIADQGAE